MSVCVINRETHSLFIFFHSLNLHFNISTPLNNYLLEPTSLGESNNPVPQNYGDFALRSTRRVNLDTNVGTIAPTYNGGLTSMSLHDLFTLFNLPIKTSRHGMTQLHYRYFLE